MIRAALRPAIHLVLALALAWAGLAVAQARGGAGAEAVICSGTGVVAVALDASGHPTGRHGACPDGVLGFAALAALAPALGPPARVRTAAPAARKARLSPRVPRAAALPRGPPLRARAPSEP